MLDDFSKRTKAIRAMLELAQEAGWEALSLSDIAGRAGLNLADLRQEFSCKSDILRAFQKEVDGEVLSKVRVTPGQGMRDKVFDIVMTRFEVMGPYKPALRRIATDLSCRPGEAASLACSSLASQYWMLAGAGAKLDGLGTGVRVAGLAAVYGKAFQVWLDDNSPGLDRTMATLDRKLRKGEDWLMGMERLCRCACGFMPRGWGRRTEPGPTPTSSAAPAM
jgi:ubiquinone biosynthesis protein COQ9